MFTLKGLFIRGVRHEFKNGVNWTNETFRLYETDKKSVMYSKNKIKYTYIISIIQ